MKVANGTTLQVVEGYVMNLRRAALAVLLVPAMVLAAAEGVMPLISHPSLLATAGAMVSTPGHCSRRGPDPGKNNTYR